VLEPRLRGERIVSRPDIFLFLLDATRLERFHQLLFIGDGCECSPHNAARGKVNRGEKRIRGKLKTNRDCFVRPEWFFRPAGALTSSLFGTPPSLHKERGASGGVTFY
jgi:hypothetical protein